MKRTTLMLAVLALLFGGVGQLRADFTTLSLPGAAFTVASGVSGNNLVGYYQASGDIYGFLYNGSTYTTLDPAGSTYTEAYGVSGNNVVGFYYTNTGYGYVRTDNAS